MPHPAQEKRAKSQHPKVLLQGVAFSGQHGDREATEAIEESRGRHGLGEVNESKP